MARLKHAGYICNRSGVIAQAACANRKTHSAIYVNQCRLSADSERVNDHVNCILAAVCADSPVLMAHNWRIR